MRLRTLLIGWAAVVFGSSAAVGAYLLSQKPAEGPDAPVVAIVVAAGSAPRGVTLSNEMLELQPWPEEYVPEGALRSLEEAEGRAVWIPLAKGEPVTDPKLTARGAGRGMAAMIPRGMRAVTLQTPNVSTAMAGFILPGNKVDVLLTLNQSGFDPASGGGSSVTLLQNVEVLAVDQQIDAPNENVVDPKGMQSVTLLVTPAEASRLDLGQSRGTLRLALRNPEDSEISDVQSALLSALQTGPSLPEQAEPEQAEPEAEQAEPAETVVQVADEKPRANILLPIRTLRGRSNTVAYLRRAAPRHDTVIHHQLDSLPATSESE